MKTICQRDFIGLFWHVPSKKPIVGFFYHRLDGPANIGYRNGISYYVNNKFCYNFIEYIRAVIEFHKLNSSKDKI